MRLFFLLFTAVVLLELAACGGGGSHSVLAPRFTSTPGLSATQDVVYRYDITATDPSGGSVSFAVSSGPAGAAISGNALSWTPTAAQSRVDNGFTITATTSEGDSATQSWTIAPSGMINGTRTDTYWTASGSAMVPFDWTSANQTIAALVPQTDGSFQTLTGSGNYDGTFSIPNVPGGYYWLQIGAGAYWTSSSTFDLGSNIAGRQSVLAICIFCSPTKFDFAMSELDAMAIGEQVEFLTDLAYPFSISALVPANLTTFTATVPALGNVPDFSEVSTAFFMQLEPRSVGSIQGVDLGPELTFSNLSLSNNADNSITGALVASPQVLFDLNVKGSLWAPLFNNVGPNAATPVGAYLNVIAQPFLAAGSGQLGGVGSVNLPLFLTDLTKLAFGSSYGEHAPGPCQPAPAFTDGSNIAAYAAPVLTDQEFGALLYGDPYPSAWPRFFSLCQTATMPVPIPGSNTSATFVFDAGVNTALPTSSFAPMISQVQNPTIQGASFYSASTVTTKFPTVSWSLPAKGTASGYRIGAYVLTTLQDGNQGYVPSATYYTLQSSVVLPTLLPNNTYVFVLTALSDSLANVESSPNRSGLPNGFVSVVSAPITINSGTQ